MLRGLVALVFFAVCAWGLIYIAKVFGYFALLGIVGLLGLAWVVYRVIFGHWPDQADWAQPRD